MAKSEFARSCEPNALKLIYWDRQAAQMGCRGRSGICSCVFCLPHGPFQLLVPIKTTKSIRISR